MQCVLQTIWRPCLVVERDWECAGCALSLPIRLKTASKLKQIPWGKEYWELEGRNLEKPHRYHVRLWNALSRTCIQELSEPNNVQIQRWSTQYLFMGVSSVPLRNIALALLTKMSIPPNVWTAFSTAALISSSNRISHFSANAYQEEIDVSFIGNNGCPKGHDTRPPACSISFAAV